MDKTFESAPKADVTGRDESVVRLVRIVVAGTSAVDDDEQEAFYASFCISDESVLSDFVPMHLGADAIESALSEHFGQPIPRSVLSFDLPRLLGYLDTRFPGWERVDT